MIHFKKDFKDLDLEEIQSLIDNGIAEDKYIEYKLKLPTSEDEKRKLVQEICSFANTSGGVILIGVEEKREAGKKTGLPISLPGIDLNEDEEKRKLESVLGLGIQPRIPNIQFRAVQNGATSIWAIKVPRSYLAPHMLVLQGKNVFYVRTNSGTLPMDYLEVKDAFTENFGLGDKIHHILSDRLSTILGEPPIPLEDHALVMLHVVPLNSLDRRPRYPAAMLEQVGQRNLVPLHHSGWSNSICTDGYMTYYPHNVPTQGYGLLFRNGMIEWVDTVIARNPKEIHVFSLEDSVLNAVKQGLGMLKSLGHEPPFALFLTLHGVRGLTRPDYGKFQRPREIDRTQLRFPEVVLEAFEGELKVLLKPLFDSLWNSFGDSGSFSYDDTGKWIRITRS